MVVFAARDGTSGYELWATDGTTAGTSLLSDLYAGSYGSYPFRFTLVGTGLAAFAADDEVYGTEFWITDGTTAGTSLVRDIYVANQGSAPVQFSPVCFAAGTRIATPSGDAMIEALRPGDLIRTASGQDRPIRWIGHRRVHPGMHADRDHVAPIRVRAHAFGPGAPGRDLLLSPAHAVPIDGVLVPIDLLINGASIVREPDCADITYFHIELDSHDLLVANGLAAESYLDTGNRAFFANGGVVTDLRPTPHSPLATDDLAAQAWCLPLVTEPGRVEPLWQGLADRAGTLGWFRAEIPMTSDPGLRVLVDGRAVEPTRLQDGRYQVAIPTGSSRLTLLSRTARPADTRPWLGDRRNLGVLVRGVETETTDGSRPLAPERLETGWYGVEAHGVRWSDGAGEVPLTDDTVAVTFEVVGTLSYPLEVSREHARQAA